MRIKIGDLVRFVDEAIEGRVTSLHAEDIIGVTDETGFEIPVPMNKVTLVHGQMEEPQDDDSTTQHTGHFVEKGIFVVVAGNPNEGLATFHLLNETSFTLLFAASAIRNNKMEGIRTAQIQPYTTLEFFSANFSVIGKWPVFQVDIIKYLEAPHPKQEIITKEFRFKPSDLNTPQARHDLLEKKGWFVQIDKEEESIGLDRLKNFGK